MCGLLICLLLYNSTVVRGTQARPAVELPPAGCPHSSAPVIVVADGSSDWPAQAADSIVTRLKSRIGPCYMVEVARFNAGPALRLGFALKGSERDLVMVKPRVPLRDMMEEGLSSLIAYPRPRAMVVIAHAQTQPTSVSAGRLLELAQQSAIRVHTIHLASSHRERGVFRRLTQPANTGISHLAQKLGQAEAGYSASDTARLLKRVADGTGGTACSAEGETTQIACADAIAEDLASDRRRD